MVRAAYLFSGQGQQFEGMGMDLYESEPAYRTLVDDASKILNQDFSKQEVIGNPDNLQLSIVILSLGVERILRNEKITPYEFLGLSLGEYSALIAAGSFSMQDGLKVVADRGQYMAEAGQKHPGQMVAVLNATQDVMEQAMVAARKLGEVYPANYNTPKQTVFGGNASGIAEFIRLLKAAGVKRVVPLKMSVASHTPFMKSASVQLAQRLRDVKVNQPNVTVISNTIKSEFTAENIKQTLVDQLVNPTHFTDCLAMVENSPIDCLVEIGPGKALSGFAKKTLKNKDLPIFNVYDVETLQKLRNYLLDQEG
ncbi:ACP S-malonyltransferase [Pediococcus stilesii]|uniref:Malonyl CoA-acyl carrier protein transacylase n=1 Tax=Pediococcus stilesii TaxID=331679 RepID=A0A0R2L0B8_9LACO|nr:ACP S-malonyltransferase [Pediococcus stilesii]KRN95231.1 [Acyl-carrier-protein] S-malonyltransferase [Pediococcus stilesii]